MENKKERKISFIEIIYWAIVVIILGVFSISYLNKTVNRVPVQEEQIYYLEYRNNNMEETDIRKIENTEQLEEYLIHYNETISIDKNKDKYVSVKATSNENIKKKYNAEFFKQNSLIVYTYTGTDAGLLGDEIYLTKKRKYINYYKY